MRRESGYPLEGGENLIVPALSADPGQCRATKNYELDRYGRPRRIDGYERFDGRPAPSDASYWILDYETGTVAMSASDTVTGFTSSAFGELVEQVLESGTFGGGDAAGYLVLTGVSGTFQDAENLQVSAATEAVSASTASEKGADTDALNTEYLQASIELARDKIAVVAGEGNVLGVWQYGGVKYAFRNNVGSTLCLMYKATAWGWLLVDLGRTIAFTSGGVNEIQDDDVIAGFTSSATATVKRVILTSGTWAGGDAAGVLVLYSQVGTFLAENIDTVAQANNATIAGNSAATTIQPSGRFEFVNYNFGGHAGTRRMYGCDGVSKAFEFDGTTFVPITTGMTTDTPEHIIGHENRLFLSFSGGSLQYSSLNDPPVVVAPYIWSVITDAGELGMGDEVTGLFELPGGTLGIKCRNSTFILYGSSSDDWELKPFSHDAGAIEWSGQMINTRLIVMDDRGLTSLSAVQAYGDFASATISAVIQPFLDTKLSNVQSSTRSKSKNQYRVFFDDGQGVYMTMEGSKVIGFTRVFFDDVPICCASSENLLGEEEIFFGSDNGFVYQMDSGTSFDGDYIEAFIRTHYNHVGTPQRKKRLRSLFLELDAPVETEISVYTEFNYGEGEPNDLQSFDVSGGGGVWEVDNWESFAWDGQDVGTAEAYVDGTGTSFSFLFYSNAIYTEPHTLQGVTIQYSMRGIKR